MVGKTINDIKVLSGRYMKTAIYDIERPLGHKVNEVRVKGKLIGILLDNAAILTTSGMSGSWHAGVPDSKFNRIQLTVGGELYTFSDMRNFGTFRVVGRYAAEAKFNELGPDIFTPDPPEEFFQRVEAMARKQTLAEGLMNQNIVSGIGNYIRADAMYIAKEHPKNRLSGMSRDRLAAIWRAAHQVAVEAYRLEHEYVDLCYRRKHSVDGHEVVSYEDHNGRTVWYAPAVAKAT